MALNSIFSAVPDFGGGIFSTPNVSNYRHCANAGVKKVKFGKIKI
jgi:hypothetical protein